MSEDTKEFEFHDRFLGRVSVGCPQKHFGGQMQVYTTGSCCEGYLLASRYGHSGLGPNDDGAIGELELKIFPIDFVPRTVVPIKDLTNFINLGGGKGVKDISQPQLLVAGQGCSGIGIRLVTRDAQDVNYKNYIPVQRVLTPEWDNYGYTPSVDTMLNAYEQFVGHTYGNKDWSKECCKKGIIKLNE